MAFGSIFIFELALASLLIVRSGPNAGTAKPLAWTTAVLSCAGLVLLGIALLRGCVLSPDTTQPGDLRRCTDRLPPSTHAGPADPATSLRRRPQRPASQPPRRRCHVLRVPLVGA